MPKKDDSQPPPLKVGLTYNLKRDNKNEAEAEFDSIDTINAIKSAIEKLGHEAVPMEADSSLADKIKQIKPDIVFNIAEGTNGRGREAHVPAMLSYFSTPFTGSDETTLCICLDKALTKRVLISHKVKTPKYQLIESRSFKLQKNLDFPIIAKPNAEGSSKGISTVCVARSEEELRAVVDTNFKEHGYTLLAEEFVEGREFTVGIVGNSEETVVFRPMEVVFKKQSGDFNVYDYAVKKDYEETVEYVCPAHIDADIELRMQNVAKKIYNVLGCRDFARIDFRLSPYNEIYFIEINPLAGLTPGYSDFPMNAQKNGLEFDALIAVILNSALKRYKLGGN